jgi:MFS family permease
MMTVSPAPGGAPISTGSHPPRSRVAAWAVGLAAVCGLAFVASAAAIALAYAFGEESAVEDTWLGALLATVAAAGVLGSVAGFALGLAAKAQHEHWRLLWLPLSVFPALAVFLVLGEALWWE